MSDGLPRALQVAGLTAFCVGLAAVAAATCVLSYAGIHAVAQQGGIQARYAKDYPLLIDALLVIVLAAVLALRGAGLPSRILSWVGLLVLLGAAAGAEALHATGRRLPRDAAAITVAALPWLLVLLTFVLLLAMLRQARLRRLANTAPAGPAPAYPDVRVTGTAQPPPYVAHMPVRTSEPWSSPSIVPGFSSQLASAAAAGAAAGAAAAERGSRGPGGGSAWPASSASVDQSSLQPGPDVRDAGEPAGSRRVGSAQQADDDEPDGGLERSGPPNPPAC